MIAAGVCATSLSLGSHVASGSDPYGYVSQAQLWSQGSLIQPEPLVRLAVWPNAAATLAPLGYRPAQRAFGNVPTYAPGLPILMALARIVGGPCAVYVVVPITAALLVWFTYLLAVRVSDPLVAVGAAVWMATSPTLFFMMMWPLSDVPVSACWLLALLIASSSTTWRGALVTGAVTGLAILIRPNLVPLAIVPSGLVLFRIVAIDRSAWWRAALAIVAGLLPFIAGVAILNASLYGSPLESGYGSLSGLYSIGRVRRNFVLQTEWLFESQGFYLLAVLLGGALQLRRGFGNVLTWGLGFAALVWCAYLPYYSYDAWWYLRFLLPAFPIVFIVAIDGVASVAGWFGPTARVLVTSIFVVAAATHGAAFARDKRIVGLGEGEQRAIEVASFVAQSLPEKAVLVSGQHSGSIRYYSGRTTLRFDQLDAAWLDRTVEMLSGLGYHPYAVLDDWEEPIFALRFRGQSALSRIAAGPIAALDRPMSVKVYDLQPSSPDRPAAVQQIRHIPAGTCHEPSSR